MKETIIRVNAQGQLTIAPREFGRSLTLPPVNPPLTEQ